MICTKHYPALQALWVATVSTWPSVQSLPHSPGHASLEWAPGKQTWALPIRGGRPSTHQGCALRALSSRCPGELLPTLWGPRRAVLLPPDLLRPGHLLLGLAGLLPGDRTLLGLHDGWQGLRGAAPQVVQPHHQRDLQVRGQGAMQSGGPDYLAGWAEPQGPRTGTAGWMGSPGRSGAQALEKVNPPWPSLSCHLYSPQV